MSAKWKALLACVLGMMLMCEGALSAGFTVSASVSPKTAEPAETVKVAVTFTTADSAIRGVQMVISVPGGMLFESQNTPDGWTDFADGASILAVNSGSLQPGASVTFELLLKVKAGTADTQKIIFTNVRAATAAAESIGGNVSGDGLDIGIGKMGNLPGDANGDGGVDIMDLVAIIDFIVSDTSDTSPTSIANADANADGVVDIMDLVWIIDKIVSG